MKFLPRSCSKTRSQWPKASAADKAKKQIGTDSRKALKDPLQGISKKMSDRRYLGRVGESD